MSKVGQRILTNLREVVTMAELQAEITRLREERRWIPVDEQLPDLSRVVLVYSTSNGIHRASLDSLGHQWLDEDENPGKKITHWQPLPPQPSEGGVEG